MKAKLVLYPDEVLRKKCRGIETEENYDLVAGAIREVFGSVGNAVGVSGPQVGYDRRIFGIKMGHREEIFLEPEIVKRYGEKEYLDVEEDGGEREEFLEGCLSFPDIFGRVKRWLKIRARYKIGFGSEFVEREMEGFESVVFQHELDHLSGVLFVDHIKEGRGQIFEIKGGKKKILSIDEILVD